MYYSHEQIKHHIECQNYMRTPIAQHFTLTQNLYVSGEFPTNSWVFTTCSDSQSQSVVSRDFVTVVHKWVSSSDRFPVKNKHISTSEWMQQRLCNKRLHMTNVCYENSSYPSPRSQLYVSLAAWGVCQGGIYSKRTSVGRSAANTPSFRVCVKLPSIWRNMSFPVIFASDRTDEPNW